MPQYISEFPWDIQEAIFQAYFEVPGILSLDNKEQFSSLIRGLSQADSNYHTESLRIIFRNNTIGISATLTTSPKLNAMIRPYLQLIRSAAIHSYSICHDAHRDAGDGLQRLFDTTCDPLTQKISKHLAAEFAQMKNLETLTIQLHLCPINSTISGLPEFLQALGMRCPKLRKIRIEWVVKGANLACEQCAHKDFENSNVWDELRELWDNNPYLYGWLADIQRKATCEPEKLAKAREARSLSGAISALMSAVKGSEEGESEEFELFCVQDARSLQAYIEALNIGFDMRRSKWVWEDVLEVEQSEQWMMLFLKIKQLLTNEHDE